MTWCRGSKERVLISLSSAHRGHSYSLECASSVAMTPRKQGGYEYSHSVADTVVRCTAVQWIYIKTTTTVCFLATVSYSDSEML